MFALPIEDPDPLYKRVSLNRLVLAQQHFEFYLSVVLQSQILQLLTSVFSSLPYRVMLK